jgi:RES domain-containing protein
MYSLTPAQLLAFVGVKTPTQDQTDWATAVSKAIVAALTQSLNGATIASPSGAEDELNVALLIGGAEAYKRQEATFAQAGYADLEGNAIKFSRDYLDSIKPIINRYAVPGIG